MEESNQVLGGRMDATWIETALCAAIAALSSAIGFLFRENRKLFEENVECRKKQAELEGRQVATDVLLEQMTWRGAVQLEAFVVADQNGRIEEWSPGATLLTHWTEREMLGKNIDLIIPMKYKQLHHERMGIWRQAGRLPRRGPFGFFVITKEGYEVPVEVTLSGWKTDDETFVAATIRRRKEDSKLGEILDENSSS